MPRCDWSPASVLRADWWMRRRSRTLSLYLLLSCLLHDAPSSLASSASSSPPAPPAPPLDAELLRDAPLYPPLQDLDTLPYDNRLYDIQQTDAFGLTRSDVPLGYDSFEEKNKAVQPSKDDYDFGSILDEARPETDDLYKVQSKEDYRSPLEELNSNDLPKEQKQNFEERSSLDVPIIKEIANELDVTDYEVDSEEAVTDDDVADDDDDEDDNDADADVDEVDDEGDRKKRSANQELNKTKASPPRVQTGDTILNIRGSVRDSIGDGSPPRAAASPAAPPRPASRLDAVVIRPAAAAGEERARGQRDPNEDEQVGVSPGLGTALVVEAGARATLVCDLLDAATVKWYRDGELVSLPFNGAGSEPAWRELLPPDPSDPPAPAALPGSAGAMGSARARGREAVVVARASRGDAARWRCAGEGKSGSVAGTPIDLMIYEPVRAVYLAVDGRRLDAGNTWVPARDRTTIDVRCVAEGGVPRPALLWRLAGAEAALDAGLYLRLNRTNHSLQGVSWSAARVLAARELHNASLQCTARQARAGAAGGEGGVVETTAQMLVHVTYPPSFVISRWPGFGVALAAGAAAALRCDVDANPPARAWWQRDGATTTSPPPLEGGAGGGAATLRWAALPAAAAGWYRCRASWLHTDYSSIGYYLNVQASESSPPAPAEPEPAPEPEQQQVEVPLGGSAQLNCPKGSVGCWWRREDNSTRSWAPAGSRHAHGVLGIKDAVYEEGGEYRCLGAAAPDLARLRELKRVTVKVTGAATAAAVSARPVAGGWRLECAVCGAGVRAAWLRGAGGEAAGGAGGAGGAATAELRPDHAPHCWRAVLHVTEPDEVWCVASSPGGGAVAVFPPRAPRAAPHTPAPRHLVRGGATVLRTSTLLLLTAILLQ